MSYSWIAINRKYAEPGKGTMSREFVVWGLTQGRSDGVGIGYVPLEAGVIALGKQALGAAGL